MNPSFRNKFQNLSFFKKPQAVVNGSNGDVSHGRVSNGEASSAIVPIKSASHEAPLRFLVIGAGSRGNAYARALQSSTKDAIIAAVAEPVEFKRKLFAKRHIWPHSPQSDQCYHDWQDFIKNEIQNREKRELGQTDNVPPAVDGVFVCTLDETHVEIITALAPLGLHIMSEKPLATSWTDCLGIYRSLQPVGATSPSVIFSVGHVLRYSPHNVMLRKLLLEDDVIGDVLSIELTEPVGYWHFAHSYVRGNWRKESKAAPSLLTKSCHDIDVIMWLLCSPPRKAPNRKPHLPTRISSTGSLIQYRRERKPALAGNATNCLSCPAESKCIYSAPKIYVKDQLQQGNVAWPIHIVDPEIEDILKRDGKEASEQRLIQRLSENYNESTPQDEIDSRPWFGRCVYESTNDVCDDQLVTISWEDDPDETAEIPLQGRGRKNAVFHMVASTQKRCERRGFIYGTHGEISYDSTTISVIDFESGMTREYQPKRMAGAHGGGDYGLAMGFYEACRAVKEGMSVEEAQMLHVGCTLEEAVRSHGVVFAAEEARREEKIVKWDQWWEENVSGSPDGVNGKESS